MTKAEFMKMFRLFKCVIPCDNDDLFSYAPSAHLIDHCGGYELELHPSRIMWDREISCLSMIADKLSHSVECRFYNGSIIIR
jgi:hypothetical protein